MHQQSDESKAERKPYLKWHVDDWTAGTVGMTCEQEGFYHRCLMRMWSRKGGLPHDLAWLSGALQCDRRQVRRLVDFLLREGKLVDVYGYLVNPRMVREIQQCFPTTSPRLRAQVRPKSARSPAEVRDKKSEK